MKRTVLAIAAFGFAASAAFAQATITVSPEVETEFRTYVTEQKVEPVTVDTDITVGAELPDTVVFQPVPDVIVEKSPEFKGYRYAYVGERIVIVEPSSTKVVAVVGG